MKKGTKKLIGIVRNYTEEAIVEDNVLGTLYF